MHRTALAELPALIRGGKVNKERARRSVTAISIVFAILETITDDEYEDILNRIEIKGPEYEQGSLF